MNYILHVVKLDWPPQLRLSGLSVAAAFESHRKVWFFHILQTVKFEKRFQENFFLAFQTLIYKLINRRLICSYFDNWFMIFVTLTKLKRCCWKENCQSCQNSFLQLKWKRIEQFWDLIDPICGFLSRKDEMEFNSPMRPEASTWTPEESSRKWTDGDWQKRRVKLF